MIYTPLNGNELIFNMEKFVEPELPDQTYKVLANVECSSKPILFCVLRDFICKRSSILTHDFSNTGIGYTLIDSFYDSNEFDPVIDDWYVIKSVNEKGLSTYFKVTYQNTDYLSVIGFRYWNAETHNGIDPFYEVGAHIPLANISKLFIYGDTTSLAIIVLISDEPSLFLFGSTNKSPYDQRVLTVTNELTSGSSVALSLNRNIDSYVDDKVFVFDNQNIELTIIKDINTITKNIKVDLAHNYPNLASVTADICLFIQVSNDLSNINNFRCLIDGNGVINSSLNWDIFDTLLDQHDPSGMNNDYLTSDISLSGSGGFKGYLRNIQVLGFGANLPNNSIFSDHQNNWRLFTINGYKLLFREA